MQPVINMKNGSVGSILLPVKTFATLRGQCAITAITATVKMLSLLTGLLQSCPRKTLLLSLLTSVRVHPTLQDDTFLLVIMTSYQSQLFEEFAYKVVCMDSTHKTNEYRFKLITLLVVDAFHKGRLMH